MRTHASIIPLMSALLLAACDSGEPYEPEPELEELVFALPDGDAASPGTVVAEPHVLEDVPCQTFYFTTSQNDAKKSECTVGVTAPQFPFVYPLWDDILTNELAAQSSATCAGLGARDGNDNLPAGPGPGGGAPFEGDIDDLADPVASPSAPGIGGKTTVVPTSAAAPAQCQVVCASHGKLWNSASANFGTCSYNRMISLNAPAKAVVGPACPVPGNDRWTMGGGVVFDCGCNCI